MGILKELSASRSAVSQALGVLDQLREAVTVAREDNARILTAPPPLDEIMAGLDRWIDQASTQAFDALRPQRLLSDGRAVEGFDLPIFLERHENVAVHNTTRATEVLLGLVVGLNRETFRSIIAGQLQDLIDGRETLSASTRAKRLAVAEQRLLEAELLEEAAVRALEAAGVEVVRRPDCDPRALLAADTYLDQIAA